MVNAIDSHANWAAGDDILVSTGDIVDRGDDTIALYQLFDRLRAQAPKSGGYVLNSLGNHEYMNALADWRYVTKGDIESFGGAVPRRKAMSENGWIGQTWSANYSVNHVVSLLPEHLVANAKAKQKLSSADSYLPPRASFVHGGITPSYAARGPEYINKVGHAFLDRALSMPLEKLTGHLPPSTPDEEKELYGSNGPLWYRGYATDRDDDACRNAEQALDALSLHGSRDVGTGMPAHGRVNHLVMGHTPHFDGHVIRCASAQILLIDTGISRAYGGEQSALVFETELVPPSALNAGRVDAAGPIRRGSWLLQFWPWSGRRTTHSATADMLSKPDPRSPQPWIQRQKITSYYYGRLPRTIRETQQAVYL